MLRTGAQWDLGAFSMLLNEARSLYEAAERHYCEPQRQRIERRRVLGNLKVGKTAAALELDYRELP